MPIACGIDPGLKGGIVITDGDSVVFQTKMPTLDIGKKNKSGKGKVNNVTDIDEVYQILVTHQVDGVAIEFQQAFSGQGISSTGKMLRAFGQLEGVCIGLGVYYKLPRPKVWQKMLKGTVGEGKDRAINYIKARLPDLDLTPGQARTPQDGLSDAGVIALWMYEELGGEEKSPNPFVAC